MRSLYKCFFKYLGLQGTRTYQHQARMTVSDYIVVKVTCCPPAGRRRRWHPADGLGPWARWARGPSIRPPSARRRANGPEPPISELWPVFTESETSMYSNVIDRTGGWGLRLRPPWGSMKLNLITSHIPFIYRAFICKSTALNELEIQRIINAPLWVVRELDKMEVKFTD